MPVFLHIGQRSVSVHSSAINNMQASYFLFLPKTGHCKIQNRPLRVKAGQYLMPHRTGMASWNFGPVLGQLQPQQPARKGEIAGSLEQPV